ncbi:thiol-disulfide oxidoreductase DCC family protein [Tropicibacter naphthalenivorans]|uniref:Thiol-disulfide oxidoreductase DCC n=1 Tax=Tropicibacter naphthalenivorans TaxID=441103 RepID=A0A0P1GGE2_9RHOB|nr:thiol-disulfide oxidoreductase DCC family protein [Tropicibacter naphthalenivorans]CUH80869.1 hypothetical protein TRN7648_03207 [Tropicibacter naphthalenivorans]SMC90742.1 Predicted thiol-disulfide oxidoreductase YuxK, DCC family [Tropicibacter naphthalenivorans]
MTPTVLFDAHCVLCTGSVAFILRHERAPTLHFASVHSAQGAALAARHGLTPEMLDQTFALITDRALLRSDAALHIAAHLRHPWRAATLARIIPRPLRDALYSAVARNRYRLFGRRETCYLPPPEAAHRFDSA